MAKKRKPDTGQGTLEAAITIPVLFVLMLLLIQPGIVLYDRVVMHAAAAEGCRLLATKGDALGSMDGACEAYIRHRLASIPQHECFHVHEKGCTWDIAFTGDESSSQVSVSISTEIKPLPLFDGASVLLGLANSRGNWDVAVQVAMATQPDWVGAAPAGMSPAGWIGVWS